ncbi:trigger factor [Mycoplasmopsis caviae]|uniref:Trigger factor n=1 Tax=Mycoplasmopsis caviae TaxID=55603 RepID=A0A3P8L7A3_9BACT|nr:trigger factor [Mycoplasmopsis caviae]UUD35128.1 trigger factor [Mycoplasmopsis caviae]VDR42055.1 Trigger factor [Mycoplasmopsis caviae]
MADNNKNVTIDEKKSELTYKLEINGKEWEKLYAETLEKKVKSIKIPGFRPGKAPQHEINKRINPLEIANDAIDAYWTKNYASIKEQLTSQYKRLAFIPQMELKNFDPQKGAELDLIFPLLPDFEKIEIKSPKTKFELLKVTKKDVEDFIKQSLERNALIITLEKNEKTKIGDFVTLNYKGFVNNEPFDGGEAQNFDLKLGSKTFIDTFEEQLVGKKIGWKGEVKVTFPKDYGVDKLSGQPAIFEVEIVDARRKENVELTEKNINSVQLPKMANVKNIDDLKKEVKLTLEISSLDESIEKFFELLIDEFLEKNKFEVHKIFVKDQVKEALSEVESNLKRQKVKFYEYLKLLGKTKEQFIDFLTKDQINKVKHQTISNQIFNSVEATFEKEKFESRILSIAYSMGFEPDIIKNAFFDENGKITKDGDVIKKLETFVVLETILAKYDKEGFAEYSKAKDELTKILDKKIKEYFAKDKQEETKKDESKDKPKTEKKTTKKATSKK